MKITIFLDFPPSVNSYYVTIGRSNMRRVSLRGKLYAEKVLESCVEQLGAILSSPLNEPLYVEVILHPPDTRTRDLDNYMKALLDSLTKAGLWTDDSLIDQLEIRRGAQVKGGLVQVYITEAGPIVPLPNIYTKIK